MTEKQSITVNPDMVMDEKTKQAVEDYGNGKIDIAELRAQTIDSGINWWDARTEPNPQYGPRDNRSRDKGQTYNPFNHPTGKFWQAFLKPTIIKLIGRVAENPWILKTPVVPKVVNFIHTQMIEKYYSDVFTYDDERLIFIETFLKSYIDMEFMNGYPKKHDFMNQVVDIILGLCKEDIYYRARFLDGLQKFMRLYNAKYPDSDNENKPSGGIPLTALEKENITKWH